MFHLHFHLPYSAAGFFAGAALILATPVQADKIKHPIAVFSGLDKITGRTIAFQAATGETVQFGTLQITERACLTRPATEAPQTTSFVEVDEVDAAKKYKRIFSGWMFAASPGLHGIEHPIYDIWLTECTGGHEPPESGPAPDPAAVMPPPDMPDAPPAPASKPPRTRDHGQASRASAGGRACRGATARGRPHRRSRTARWRHAAARHAHRSWAAARVPSGPARAFARPTKLNLIAPD